METDQLNITFRLSGRTLSLHDVGITVSSALEETRPFMVAFFKFTPQPVQLRQRRDVAQAEAEKTRRQQRRERRKQNALNNLG